MLNLELRVKSLQIWEQNSRTPPNLGENSAILLLEMNPTDLATDTTYALAQLSFWQPKL